MHGAILCMGLYYAWGYYMHGGILCMGGWEWEFMNYKGGGVKLMLPLLLFHFYILCQRFES